MSSAQSLVFSVVFCGSLFVFLSFYLWPLYFLSFSIWLLITRFCISNYFYARNKIEKPYKLIVGYSFKYFTDTTCGSNNTLTVQSDLILVGMNITFTKVQMNDKSPVSKILFKRFKRVWRDGSRSLRCMLSWATCRMKRHLKLF